MKVTLIGPISHEELAELIEKVNADDTLVADMAASAMSHAKEDPFSNLCIEGIEDPVAVKMRFLGEMIVAVHDLLHGGHLKQAQELLCPVVALLHSDDVPDIIMEAMIAKLNYINSVRERASCEGSA